VSCNNSCNKSVTRMKHRMKHLVTTIKDNFSILYRCFIRVLRFVLQDCFIRTLQDVTDFVTSAGLQEDSQHGRD